MVMEGSRFKQTKQDVSSTADRMWCLLNVYIDPQNDLRFLGKKNTVKTIKYR